MGEKGVFFSLKGMEGACYPLCGIAGCAFKISVARTTSVLFYPMALVAMGHNSVLALDGFEDCVEIHIVTKIHEFFANGGNVHVARQTDIHLHGE